MFIYLQKFKISDDGLAAIPVVNDIPEIAVF